MRKLFIIKTGTTFASIAEEFGDFDDWTEMALGRGQVETCVLDVVKSEGLQLPSADQCAGVVITGSHAMVTEELFWSIRIEEWLPGLISRSIPIFGICFGHQLLARAAGGQVGFHPQGKEIGTVGIGLLEACADDALFDSLPSSFLVHVTHSQTVLRLPSGAIRLAANDFEPNHAFRLGDCAWGVQFHPEYTTAIMQAYIEAQVPELSAAGHNVKALKRAVTETPTALKTIRGFGRFVEQRLKLKPFQRCSFQNQSQS